VTEDLSDELTGPSGDEPAPADDVATPAEVEAPQEPPPTPQTGDRLVDEAMEAVTAAFAEPLDVQLVAYEAAHRALADRLADVGS
jgi:hypothetical protein